MGSTVDRVYSSQFHAYKTNPENNIYFGKIINLSYQLFTKKGWPYTVTRLTFNKFGEFSDCYSVYYC